MTTRRSPALRLGFRLVLCALAGLVITVLSAWGLTLLGTGVGRMPQELRWATPTADGWPSRPSFRSHSPLVGRDLIICEWGSPGGEPIAPDRAVCSMAHTATYRTGWPFLALEQTESRATWYDIITTGNGIATITMRYPSHATGLPLPQWIPVSARTGLAAPGLPIEPLWGGLIGNTAAYGALFFLLWSVPERALRHRTGRCIACGYDLRGAPPGGACPECGTSPQPPQK